jgi:hypothetical protein
MRPKTFVLTTPAKNARFVLEDLGGRRELNPHGVFALVRGTPPDPKSGASTSSATSPKSACTCVGNREVLSAKTSFTVAAFRSGWHVSPQPLSSFVSSGSNMLRLISSAGFDSFTVHRPSLSLRNTFFVRYVLMDPFGMFDNRIISPRVSGPFSRRKASICSRRVGPAASPRLSPLCESLLTFEPTPLLNSESLSAKSAIFSRSSAASRCWRACSRNSLALFKDGNVVSMEGNIALGMRPCQVVKRNGEEHEHG